MIGFDEGPCREPPPPLAAHAVFPPVPPWPKTPAAVPFVQNNLTEHSLFSCDLATGEFAPAPGGVEGPRRRNARAAGTALAMSLGDAFPPGPLLRPGGLTACADACGHAEPDTVRALPTSCMSTGLANRHAGDWWRPPTRGSPAPGPGRPPGGSASVWPASAARTPSAASWASAWPSSAGVGRRPALTAFPSTPRDCPTPAGFPSRPSQATTATSARRFASSASCGGIQARSSSSATSPAA